jgi:hypothetical protein
MSDEHDTTQSATDEVHDAREHERQAKEHEGAERSPEERREAAPETPGEPETGLPPGIAKTG